MKISKEVAMKPEDLERYRQAEEQKKQQYQNQSDQPSDQPSGPYYQQYQLCEAKQRSQNRREHQIISGLTLTVLLLMLSAIMVWYLFFGTPG
jgi:hypothetical protein